MSHHPTTFQGESPEPHGLELDDSATLHRADDAGGMLGAFKAVRRGTLGELVRFVAALPEDQRSGYVIEKDGDRRLDTADIMALAAAAAP